MSAARRGSLFRVSSLVLPSYCAWSVAFDATASSELQHQVVAALGGLGLLTCVALLLRVVDAIRSRRRGEKGTWLEALDVLTASGSSMAWLGAGAILVSAWVGWASAAVVGLFGLGVLHLVILWTLLRVGGADPWRRASLSRRFHAATVTEGDSVIEELCFVDPRIPAGFRLLASGRMGARWAQSRYALESDESRGEVRLESDVGPALRGEHDAELLSVWLQDVLGLCHSAYTLAGPARLTVLPRPRRIEGAEHLLGQGGEDKEPRTTVRLPTEGSLRIREYQPGDDARRIHWLRSLTAGQIVVRLPDELPPDEPSIHLVLDTFLPDRWDARLPANKGDALTLSCDGPDVLLDALVTVWLGVGRALSDAGVRVTLVAAISKDQKVVPRVQRLLPRGLSSAQRLGASVRWQDSLPVKRLLTAPRSMVVSQRLPANAEEDAARWVVVPAELWAVFNEPPQLPSLGLLAFPIGSADNRWSRRREEGRRKERARGDHATFSVLTSHSLERRANDFLARPRSSGEARLEALR